MFERMAYYFRTALNAADLLRETRECLSFDGADKYARLRFVSYFCKASCLSGCSFPSLPPDQPHILSMAVPI